MADPRYKQGVFQGNGYQHRRRLGLTANLDTPLLHGWRQVREVDGYSVFALSLDGQRSGPERPVAEMRMTTPGERARWPYDWLARIGKNYYGFTGSLAEITCEIKAMLQVTPQENTP